MVIRIMYLLTLAFTRVMAVVLLGAAGYFGMYMGEWAKGTFLLVLGLMMHDTWKDD